MTLSVVCLLLLGSTEQQIDDIFAAALRAEKSGDCVSAADHYRVAQRLAAKLPAGPRAQVESQARSRLVRNEACRASCEVSDRDLRLFETAKVARAAGEPKRVNELCKQMLRGKDVRCRDYGEIRAFCPEPVTNADVDPCSAVPEATKHELEGMGSRVATLVEQAKQRGSIDQLVGLDRQLAEVYERVFALREQYLFCDKIYASLVSNNGKLKASRTQVTAAIRSAYVDRLEEVTSELDKVKSESMETEQKHAIVARLNDELLSDLTKLVQTQALNTSTNVEGNRQVNPKEQAALANALRGERQALESLIDHKPEFFGDASQQALVNKRDQLIRLDSMLARYEEAGKGQGLGFERARVELKDSLTLVNNALAHAESRDKSKGKMRWLYVIGVFIALGGGAFALVRSRFRRASGGDPYKEGSTQ